MTTAANYEIAELYHALSKDLYASERPAELNTDELEQYDILLEEQAFPFEEEAIELHEKNADTHGRRHLRRLGTARASLRSSSCCPDVTPRPKSERPLSKTFADLKRLTTVAGGALVLTLVGCGSSTPRQAEVEAPREVVAPAVARTEPTVDSEASQSRRERRAAEAPASPVAAEQAPESRRDRRGDRRAAEEAATAVGEPVPEAAVAAYQRAHTAMRSRKLAPSGARARAAHARAAVVSRDRT